jgi:nitroreductase
MKQVPSNNPIANIKRAKTQFPILDIIKNRYSGRSFSERKLNSDELNALFEAAAWAPSSMNEQPWQYQFAPRETTSFEQMLACLSPGNQIWVKDAAGIILSKVRLTHQANGQPNAYAWYDVGAANAFLLLQATELGFTCHIMGGFDHPKANQEFAEEGKTQVVCFIAIGEQAPADNLPEPFKTRELASRKRKGLEEFWEK